MLIYLKVQNFALVNQLELEFDSGMSVISGETGAGKSLLVDALEFVLEGRIFDAQRAQQMGLVNRIVADDQVTAEVEATAQRIADGAPLVARWHKKFARRLSQPEALSAADIEESYDCFATEDFQTGYKAFLAKEKPEFQGR